MAIWLQIAWKEWREQVWKMIAVASIALSVEVYLLINNRADSGAALVASLCLVPGAIFIAMGVAAGERTAGSLDFLRTLPVSRWKFAVARLSAGAMALLLPLAAIVVLQILVGWEKKFDGPTPGQLTVFAGLLCLSVYVWAVAAGVDRSSELGAGVAAVCLFVGWFALALALYSLCRFFVPSLRRLYDFVFVFSPVAAIRLTDTPRLVAFWEVFLAQLLALAGAGWWSVRRYGQLNASDDRSPAATSPDTLAPAALRACRRSRLAAIAWKEYRETGPICLAGLAILAALMLPMLVGLTRELGPGELGSGFFTALTLGITAFGTITAMVLGVGGYAGDLQPGVREFWRSRPIGVGGWFWTKYFTGAAVLLAVFDGALTGIDLLGGGPSLVVRDPFWWCGPVLHLFAYSTSVWMVCQLRQPVYSGILALGLVISVVLLGELSYLAPYLPWLSLSGVLRTSPRFDSPLLVVTDWLKGAYLPWAATMVGLSSVFAVLGWLAVRRVEGRLGRGFRQAEGRLARTAFVP
ncbi:MAG TPA: hypothetical protein VG826_24400 [Pirellulales bacterium]|nr:hypothetical protein [Pirellulales bacterium]